MYYIFFFRQWWSAEQKSFLVLETMIPMILQKSFLTTPAQWDNGQSGYEYPFRTPPAFRMQRSNSPVSCARLPKPFRPVPSSMNLPYSLPATAFNHFLMPPPPPPTDFFFQVEGGAVTWFLPSSAYAKNLEGGEVIWCRRVRKEELGWRWSKCDCVLNCANFCVLNWLDWVGLQR